MGMHPWSLKASEGSSCLALKDVWHFRWGSQHVAVRFMGRQWVPNQVSCFVLDSEVTQATDIMKISVKFPQYSHTMVWTRVCYSLMTVRHVERILIFKTKIKRQHIFKATCFCFGNVNSDAINKDATFVWPVLYCECKDPLVTYH